MAIRVNNKTEINIKFKEINNISLYFNWNMDVRIIILHNKNW